MTGTLTADLGAVAANVTRLALRTDGELMAVVKADGFGAGAVDVARTALGHGASWLGVTSLEEAAALRAAGLAAPVLSWLNGPDADYDWAVRHAVDVAVPSLDHLAAVARAASLRVKPARVHLHVDCGLARDGAPVDQWSRLCREARDLELAGAVDVAGVMGHLAMADLPGHPENARERSVFGWAVGIARAHGLTPDHRHLAATAATLHDPASHHTLSRIGAGLVGIDPAGRSTLHGALTLHAPLVLVREVEAGTGVGYGHAWRAPRRTRLGLVPLGYADGLPRAAAGAQLLVGGRRVPVVGRISMDQTVVDLGHTVARAGDRATVFGPGHQGEPTVAEWAAWAGTLPHEIVTGIGARVLRESVPVPGPLHMVAS